jgi:hypothetical protein
MQPPHQGASGGSDGDSSGATSMMGDSLSSDSNLPYSANSDGASPVTAIGRGEWWIGGMCECMYVRGVGM